MPLTSLLSLLLGVTVIDILVLDQSTEEHSIDILTQGHLLAQIPLAFTFAHDVAQKGLISLLHVFALDLGG